jgi:hypothetical protein
MEKYILSENVLSENILMLADENEIFKGGFVAILKEYTYQTAWSDFCKIKRFKKRKSLFNYLEKYYPEIQIHN